MEAAAGGQVDLGIILKGDVPRKGDDGACVNQAESSFAWLRRAAYGIPHRISGRYLYQYGNEMAWESPPRG